MVGGREQPIDRIIDHEIAKRGTTRQPPLDDAGFLRRVHLDLIGTLPRPAALTSFLTDQTPGKRERLIDSLTAADPMS